jgi:hypothetical protein
MTWTNTLEKFQLMRILAELWLRIAAPVVALFSASENDGRSGWDPNGLTTDGRGGFDPNG